MYAKPLLTMTPTSRPYWEGCSEGKLLLPVCDSCGHTWFPPSEWCPRCLSAEISQRQASGRGTLWSWNVFHRGYFAAFRDLVPYLTVLIRLEEGPLLTSTLVDDPDPEKLECDLPVSVVFEPVTDELTLPMFRIVSPNAASYAAPGAPAAHDRIEKEVTDDAL